MNHSFRRTKIAAAIGLFLAGSSVFADDDIRFSDFTPLSASASPTTDETKPITFGNAKFLQKSIIDRQSQLAANKPNSGNFDMNTLNQTGRHKGRYLFTVFETGSAGIQRHDRKTGQTETIWQSPGVAPALNSRVAFDASFWTPWGTFITTEESWAAGGSIYGRLFELKNPISAPGIINGGNNSGAQFVHQNVIPRTSHEGIQFDKAGNMYFIDELNGGTIFKYTSAAKLSDIKQGKADYFAAGSTFVLRVGDGNTANATGAYTWVAFTDGQGKGLPGAVTITDANGVTSVDARSTADQPLFKGTDYQRPEDVLITTEKGNEYLYVATTTTHEVYKLDLKNNTISVYANRDTIDLATGAPVGTGLTNPDNLAVDQNGNVYIVEDRNGGVDDDIWFAKDLNKDGDINDPGEGLARWASNGTPGSEFTGLYFDPFNKRRAWVNIQHPTSGNDRTIEITIPDDDHHDHDD
jgi:uncharacterized protein